MHWLFFATKRNGKLKGSRLIYLAYFLCSLPFTRCFFFLLLWLVFVGGIRASKFMSIKLPLHFVLYFSTIADCSGLESSRLGCRCGYGMAGKFMLLYFRAKVALARLSVHSSCFLGFSLAAGKVQFQNLCSVAGDQKSKVLLHSDSTKKWLKNEHEQVSGSQKKRG